MHKYEVEIRTVGLASETRVVYADRVKVTEDEVLFLRDGAPVESTTYVGGGRKPDDVFFYAPAGRVLNLSRDGYDAEPEPTAYDVKVVESAVPESAPSRGMRRWLVEWEYEPTAATGYRKDAYQDIVAPSPGEAIAAAAFLLAHKPSYFGVRVRNFSAMPSNPGQPHESLEGLTECIVVPLADYGDTRTRRL